MRLRASLMVSVLLVGLLPVLAAEPASATTITARSLLFKLSVKAESGNNTYSRTYFKHWIDANGDCQNTRTEVLIAESKIAPTYTSSRHCSVAKGKWYSYYDGVTWTNPADVDIDHLVALAEAWGSGARLWSATNRNTVQLELHGCSLLVCHVLVGGSPSRTGGCRIWCRWVC